MHSPGGPPGPSTKLAKDATLREVLAGQAMAGILANGAGFTSWPDEVAEASVAFADALISELAKEKS